MRQRTPPMFLALPLLLAAACTHAPHRAAPPRAAGPIVVIVVDTLRSDHLPAYGYRGVATPHVDALARDGVLFEHAFSHVPLTLPSHATLFTGLLPPASGVRNNGGYRLADDRRTLAEGLRATGYRTAGFVSSTVLDDATGIARGFDVWDDKVGGAQRDTDVLARKRMGRKTAEQAIAWLDRQPDGRFFLFLHLYDPHQPYMAPEPWSKEASSPYDAEIAYDDAVLGDVLDRLRRKGLYDPALVVFLSDHGEGLGDHGEKQHGMLLYREALQIPLIVKLPGGAARGTRRTEPVGITDVGTTLFAAAGLDVTPLEGIPLFGGTLPAGRAIYSETVLPKEGFGLSALRSLLAYPRHFIESPRPELYDVATDPAERRDALAGGGMASRAAPPQDLVAQLERVGSGAATSVETGAERQDRLLSLGYFGGAAAGSGTGGNPREHIGDVEALWSTAEDVGRRGDPDAQLRAIDALLSRLQVRNEQLLRLLARRFLAARRADLAARLVAPLHASADPHSRVVVGEIALEAGRADEAAALFRTALDLDPGSARAFLGLGLLALGAGDTVTAEPLLERAVALDDGTSEAWNALGVIRSRRGDAAGAAVAWQKAIDADPRLSDAWFNLAALRHRQGDRPGAAQALQRYALIVRGPERERAQALLRSLQ